MTQPLLDKLGKKIRIGQLVAWPHQYAGRPAIRIRRVTRIDVDKIYLDNSPQYLQEPQRVLILEGPFE